MIRMDRDRFEKLVAQALQELPAWVEAMTDNVEVTVAEAPSAAQRQRLGLHPGQTLLGLYQGVPLTKRGRHYGLVVPDKVTIFQKAIEAHCRNDAEIIAEIKRVVLHEIAHHFGISDARLRQLGMG